MISDAVTVAVISGVVAVVCVVVTQAAVVFLAIKKNHDEQRERDKATQASREYVISQIGAMERKVVAVHTQQGEMLRTGQHNAHVLANLIRHVSEHGGLHPQDSDYDKSIRSGKGGK